MGLSDTFGRGEGAEQSVAKARSSQTDKSAATLRPPHAPILDRTRRLLAEVQATAQCHWTDSHAMQRGLLPGPWTRDVLHRPSHRPLE